MISLWAILAMAIHPTQDGTEPARPSSAWATGYADGSCQIRRRFGTPDDPVTLIFRRTPASSGVVGLQVARSRMEPVAGQKVSILHSPSGYQIVEATSAVMLVGNEVERDVPLPTRDGFEVLLAPGTLKFNVGNKKIAEVAIADTASALAQLDSCEFAKLRQWQVDLQKISRARTRANLVNPAAIVTASDYPVGAVNQRQQSRLVVIVDADADGRVTGCRDVEREGPALFSSTVCTLVRRRAKIVPARDASGNTVPDSFAMVFRFYLPK